MAAGQFDAADQRTQLKLPFLDLPAELRDWIYDYLSGDELVLASPDSEAIISVKDIPLQNITLVNKQISHEFHDPMSSKMTLLLDDLDFFQFDFLPLSSKLLQISKLELRIFIVCTESCPNNNTAQWQAMSEGALTRESIENALIQLPNITSLEINFGVWYNSTVGLEVWPSTPHNTPLFKDLHKLTEYPKLSHIGIYGTENPCRDASKVADKNKKLAEWITKDGWYATSLPGLRTMIEKAISEAAAA